MSLERKDSREFFTVNSGKPQFYSSLEGTFRGGSLVNSIFARGDVQVNASQQLFFRYFRQDATYYADGGRRNQRRVQLRRRLDSRIFVHRGSYRDFVAQGPERVHGDVRRIVPGHAAERGLHAAAYLSTGSPRYNFPSLSWGDSPGTHFRNVYNQFRNALSITPGNHVWKFGGGIQVIPLYMGNPGNPNGTWTFSADQYFNPGDRRSTSRS